ncbi:MAG TPA: glycosyltransferase [Flavobacteriales bacterium]
MFAGARIAIAPLDWGLGHSTRDVPIIRRLLELDARPVIAADKGPLALLRDEFPQLPFVVLPGVEVRYGKGRSQAWAMAKQFPAMIRSVREERTLFDTIQRDLQLDAVISDNRFGVRADHLPSVIITHQLFPFTPLAQGALRRLNLRLIRKFDRCWVPDDAQAPGLAGELSHGPDLPSGTFYLGPISRMDPARTKAPERHHRIVAVISGPEPQRTLLDHTLMQQLPAIEGDHLLVRGLPNSPGEEVVGNVRRVGHLSGDALTAALLDAELIISRTGYTTLMDLAHIGRSALVIPTPGQAEQEYLGELHQRTGRFLVQKQERIDIPAALQGLKPGVPTIAPPAGSDDALADLAAAIARRRSPTFVGR